VDRAIRSVASDSTLLGHTFHKDLDFASVVESLGRLDTRFAAQSGISPKRSQHRKSDIGIRKVTLANSATELLITIRSTSKQPERSLESVNRFNRGVANSEMN